MFPVNHKEKTFSPHKKGKPKTFTQVDKFRLLKEHVAHHGLKWTRQRGIIADIFFKPPNRHFRLEELLKKCRGEDSSLSYATVYRTLMMLVEAGFAHQRHFGKGPSLFEPVSRHHHDHLICTSCGEIIEFENQTIEKLQEMIVKKHGFKLTHHKMELYGLCSQCHQH